MFVAFFNVFHFLLQFFDTKYKSAHDAPRSIPLPPQGLRVELFVLFVRHVWVP